MEIATIKDDYFETRASAVLRHFISGGYSISEQPFMFAIENDPFDMVFLKYDQTLYAKVKTPDATNNRDIFEIASIEHIEKLLESIEHYNTPYDDGITQEDMLAERLFEDDYFLYGLEEITNSKNKDVFEVIDINNFNVNKVIDSQSSTNDVIGAIENMYQLALGINNPKQELVDGLKLVTDFVQNETATPNDFDELEDKLEELKQSYNNKKNT